MTLKVAIAGGGIGGLAAALALARTGQQVELFEKAAAFTEIGAGIQLGPNVTRILQGWGLLDAMHRVATAPDFLRVRSATSGGVLGELRLGQAMAARYGEPYLTLHRADLHGVLLHALQQAAVVLRTDCAAERFQQTPQVVSVQSHAGTQDFDVLVGADGVWSSTRQQLLGDGPPRRTGHLAYRALIKQTDLPERLRSQNVTAWLGPKMHAVQYPVRGGEWLNVVVFVHGGVPSDFENWDHSANASDLTSHLASCCPEFQDVVQAAPNWRLWVMHDRPPMQSAHQHALGRVALLGDAAHPMRPYLAQGAGMAIEDAAELGRVLGAASLADAPAALQRYAANRWQRNARVQARALRNGQIFHATGPTRWGRDVAMKLMGERLLDMPWLYGHG
ncbi:MAG: FAD-dependent monooxygenase [Polaromonas sp.]|nr:FAD-dependent monooxygenase [Polaromonas sp.]